MINTNTEKIGSIYINYDENQMIDYESGYGVAFDFKIWIMTTNKNTKYPIRVDANTKEILWWKNQSSGWTQFASEDAINCSRLILDNFIDQQLLTTQPESIE